MKDITIISDPGVDDMVALVLLNKLARKQRKILVSTFGNHNADITGKNSEAFAAYMQDQWQYRSGAALPLNKTVERPYPDYFHGQDGLWNVQPPKAKRPAARTDTPTTSDVISLGTLTEPYALLNTQTMKRLTIMGGTFAEPGNETAWTEFNIAMDVDAAKLFFEKCQDIDVKLVPMDATQKVTWSPEDIKRIPETDQTNRWLKRLLLAWFKNYKYAADKNFVLYDPLAVYLAFRPEVATWQRSGVEVIGTGEQRGRTILSDTNPPCDIAMDIIDPDKVARQIFDILFEGDGDDI